MYSALGKDLSESTRYTLSLPKRTDAVDKWQYMAKLGTVTMIFKTKWVE